MKILVINVLFIYSSFDSTTNFINQTLLLAVIKLICLLVAIAYYTLAERKIMAACQRRHGPDVVGFGGLLQPLADGLKLLAKEFIVPTHANAYLFVAAPMGVLSLAFISGAIIPFSLEDFHVPIRPKKIFSLIGETSGKEGDDIIGHPYVQGLIHHD